MISIKAKAKEMTNADFVRKVSVEKQSLVAAGSASDGEEDADSIWLICMLGEMDPSLLEEEIPERDLEAGLQRRRTAYPQRSNWRQLVAISGFAAACSAAVTGIIVFGCMRRFHMFNGSSHV